MLRLNCGKKKIRKDREELRHCRRKFFLFLREVAFSKRPYVRRSPSDGPREHHCQKESGLYRENESCAPAVPVPYEEWSRRCQNKHSARKAFLQIPDSVRCFPYERGSVWWEPHRGLPSESYPECSNPLPGCKGHIRRGSKHTDPARRRCRGCAYNGYHQNDGPDNWDGF